MRLSIIPLTMPSAVLVSAAMATMVSTSYADRYSETPPIILSPGLTTPWVMQLQGPNAGLHPSTQIREDRNYRRKTVSTKRRKQPRAATQIVPKPAPVHLSMDPAFMPATVPYSSEHKPGTIIVDTHSKYLYFILEDGMARRYGVGVGKAGFEWSGTEKISRKAKWPGWTPPKEMIARELKKGRTLPNYMPGGPENPLGARALYLGSTLYRIHGTNQPWTIGKALSSGCIRMRNEDVTALYEQVRVGARVVVI